MTVAVHPPAPELPGEHLERWRAVPVSVLVDTAPDRQIDPAIRPLLPPGAQPPLFGPAVTVRCTAPDFGAVLAALDRVRPGDVLVIDAGGDRGTAMIGDILGGQLHRLGGAGIVCDGAVRDVRGLAAMAGLSVYSRFVTPRGPTGASEGEVGGTVTIGGVAVSAGDLVVGDDDGLAALRPADLATLIDRCEAKLALEAEWIARLTAGETVAQLFGREPV